MRARVESFTAWGTLIVLASAAISAAWLDYPLAYEFSGNAHDLLQRAGHQLTDVALGAHWVGVAVVVGVLMAWRAAVEAHAGRKAAFLNLRHWAAHLLLAIATTGLPVLLLKVLIGRSRPLEALAHVSEFPIQPWNWSPSHQSFPSGHAQVIGCAAMLLSALWPRGSAPFAVLAFWIALTRVIVAKHFLSDVLVGYWIGLAGAAWSLRVWSRWIPTPEPLTRTLFPAAEDSQHAQK